MYVRPRRYSRDAFPRAMRAGRPTLIAALLGAAALVLVAPAAGGMSTGFAWGACRNVDRHPPS